MKKLNVCMFALFLIANIGSAQARDDFSGKWVNSYGKNFLIHQYGSQAAMVMESNGNYLAIFNSRGSLPASLVEMARSKLRAVISDSYSNNYLTLGDDTSVARNISGGKIKVLALPTADFSTEATAIVSRKQSIQETICQGIQPKPRVISARLDLLSSRHPDQGSLLDKIYNEISYQAGRVIGGAMGFSESLSEILDPRDNGRSIEFSAKSCAPIHMSRSPAKELAPVSANPATNSLNRSAK